jgi:membrane-associated protein
MELIQHILHLDKFIQPFIASFGPSIYVIFFAIIFAETGFVVTPFLPGDSLLFVIGALSGAGHLNIWVSYFSLLAAAILGNQLNYWLGYKFGHRFFKNEKSRWFNKENLIKTHKFFEKYGGKTIIITRFVPVIRSFSPFVAGMGSMSHKSFMVYNIVGGFLWVTIITFAGYFFGGTKLVKDNFEYAVLAIVFISLLPAIIEYIRHKSEKKKKDK